ncbi:hypothetical protein [Gilvibacter sp.]|uniref:hypothetical protein n=1 Tax=Gilvibacter sp. TaxID=2729997 RepID=UPI0025BB9C00|nr:hypothetical protein [Gilvibacter sp.]NQX77536.1 hypothetical protein [Gilvibacter sp.]
MLIVDERQKEVSVKIYEMDNILNADTHNRTDGKWSIHFHKDMRIYHKGDQSATCMLELDSHAQGMAFLDFLYECYASYCKVVKISSGEEEVILSCLPDFCGTVRVNKLGDKSTYKEAQFFPKYEKTLIREK